MNLVYGGVGRPRFILCDANLVENGEFEVDDTDWQEVAGATHHVWASTETAYGEQAMFFEGAALARMQTLVDVDQEIQGQQIAITFATRSDAETRIEVGLYVVGASQSLGTYAVGMTQQYTLAAVDQGLVTLAGTTCFLGFKLPDAVTEWIELDHVSFRLVSRAAELENPAGAYEQDWEKILQAAYELIDGSTKEYLQGWRYTARLDYTYLSDVEETTRAQISRAAHIIFQPHQDDSFIVDARWNKAYARRYPEEVFVGHRGVIPLIGVELLNQVP